MKKTLLTILLAVSAMGTAQMTTSGSYTPTQLVNDVLLSNTSITATNIASVSGSTFGSITSLGHFNQTGPAFPFQDGIVLSTGNIATIPGPNTTTQSTGNWAGDPQYSAITGFTSNDATILEFDFVPTTDHFSFNYIFATEEGASAEMPCISTDVFAILLSDPTGGIENLAQVPGTTIIAGGYSTAEGSQCGTYLPQNFGNIYLPANANSAPANFNGITMPLTAHATVVPGLTYHLKIVVADNYDHAFDSALFIQGGSFNVTTPNTTLQATSSNGYTLCDGGSTVLSVTADPAYAYSWSTGAVGNSIVVNEAGTYTVTVALAEDTVETFTYTILDNSVSLINNGNICVDFTTGEVIQPYTLSTELNPQHYTFAWSLNGVVIAGATGNDFAAFAEGEYQVVATDIVSGCEIIDVAAVTLSSPASVTATGPSITDQTVVVNVAGFGIYEYQLDEDAAQESNVFTNVDYGTHTITVLDINGCDSISFTIEITTPDAPEGSSDQNFTPGQTLADLEVDGQNIQWYATAGSATGRNTNDNDDIPLPLTTVLEDNTTYYASQTINGIESTERLPVTVHAALAVEQNVFAGLAYYPNPVKNALIITNTEDVEDILIYNLLGQSVISKKLNNNFAEINLSMLNPGIYIIKLTSQGTEKTFKIVKE